MNEYIEISDVVINRWYNLDLYSALDHMQFEVPHIGEYMMLSLPMDIDITEKEIYTKRDVMLLFDVEEKKALSILKFLKQCGYGIQIGKSYYVTRDNMNKFLSEQAGNTIYL